MMIDSITTGIKTTFGALGITLLIMALLFIAPALFIWVLNSIAEAGGVVFRLDHSLWNYFLALVFLVLVRGSSSSKSS